MYLVLFRIIDVFLLEGMEIIFKVAIALLTLGKEDLLCLDMEGMLKVIIIYILLYEHYICIFSFIS